SIARGASVTVFVNFTATTVGDIRSAALQIKSNDPDTPVMTVTLRGLGTSGTGGTNEPSLQKVFDLYQIPITVGDSNPSDVYLDDPPVTPNDELTIQQFRKAGDGPVTITPLAAFGVGSSTAPTPRFGYYTPGDRYDTTDALTAR